ncbi:MAG: rod shape-determining protein MreD [Candidatus Omnitrophota bacterium]|nr:rod shape-determining protein MreD [Candidatus Omnitrophota bacterium]MDZ4242127.1 rod shape-determining protein MreD [Candidatus Omnitrophota bacterium]
MRKVFIIIFVVSACFVVESVLSSVGGRWFKPNLEIIAVVFFNLFWGTRYGVISAFAAGLIRDSFAVGLFGLNVFSLLSCAYLTALFKIYLFHIGSMASRVFVACVMALANLLIQYLVMVVFLSVDIGAAMTHVIVPEVLATTVIAAYAFNKIKKCVLKLSV